MFKESNYELEKITRLSFSKREDLTEEYKRNLNELLKSYRCKEYVSFRGCVIFSYLEKNWNSILFIAYVERNLKERKDFDFAQEIRKLKKLFESSDEHNL